MPNNANTPSPTEPNSDKPPVTSAPPPKTYVSLPGIWLMGAYFIIVGFLLFQNLFNVWTAREYVERFKPEYPTAISLVDTAKISKLPDTTLKTYIKEIVVPEIDQKLDSIKKGLQADTLLTQEIPILRGSFSKVQFNLLFFNMGKIPMKPEGQLILIVLLAGALGSWLHAASSFIDFVGNRNFVSSWIPWYLFRPFVGAALAFIFFVSLKSGLVGASITPSSFYHVAAFAGLVGLFTQQASKKLSDVFDVLFATKSEDKDPLDKNAEENSGQNAEENSEQNADENSGQNADENSGQNADENSGQNADENSGQNADENSGQNADENSGQNADEDIAVPIINNLTPESFSVGSENREVILTGEHLPEEIILEINGEKRTVFEKNGNQIKIKLSETDLAVAQKLPIGIKTLTGALIAEKEIEITAQA